MNDEQKHDQSLDLQTNNLFDKIVVHTGTAFFTLNILIVLAVVVSRQIPGFELNTLQSLSIYIMIVGVYIGAAISARNNSHISIKFMIDELEERSSTLANCFRVVASILSVVICTVLSYSTYLATTSNKGTTFTAVRIITPQDVYLMITVSIAVMGIYEIFNLYSHILALWKNVKDTHQAGKGNSTETGEKQ